MSLPELTGGVLLKIKQGHSPLSPIIQVLSSKPIETQSADKTRYRMLISDGKYSNPLAMFAGPASHHAHGEVAKFSVIRIKKYVMSTISATTKSADRNVLVILDFDMIKDGKEVGKLIGSPVQITPEMIASDKENTSSGGQQVVGQSNNTGGYAPSATEPVSMGAQSDPLLDIAALNPYQNKWVIKARVTNKGQVRTWSNSKGEGKLFSFDVVDQSGEIRVTAFREMVDKYYDMLQVDKIYYISKCQIKMANKQFSSVRNDYEMTMSNESVIAECHDDDTQIPTVQYTFVPIDKIAELDANTMLDIIGVCKQAGDVQSLTARSTGRELRKRDVILIDQSKAEITLTLWGEQAEQFNDADKVIAIKGARVTEFGGGKSISAMNSSIYKVDPDVQEAFTLRGWYDNGGKKEEAVNISARTGGGNMNTPWMTFKEVQDNNLGASERGDYYQLCGTVMLMRHENMIYEACPTEGCNKKVINMENGNYRCEKCGIDMTEFKYRLIGSVNVADATGNQWMTLFNDDCEQLLGANAQEIGAKAKADPNYLASLIEEEVTFNDYHFTCRIKTDTFNDESRLKTVAMRVEEIDYEASNERLIAEIEKLQA